MREKLGGKGANLAEMALIGLPVPPGFTLSTEVCTSFYANNGKYPVGLEAEVSQAVADVEEQQGKRFGDPEPSVVLGPLRCAGIHARYDGYDP